MSYRWAEHTAEVQMEIDAETKEGVFTDALRALGELLADGAGAEQVGREVAVDGHERAALLVGWLDELVFLAETEDLVPEDIEQIKLSDRGLVATVRFHAAAHGTWSRPPHTTGWYSSVRVRAFARRWCSMSEVAQAGVRGFHQVDEVVWELPAGARADMRVPARVFADRELIGEIAADRSLEQLQNVATLPGITGAALAMPDIHQATAFRSVGWPRPSHPTGSSPLAGSATTSTAACGCSRSR